MKLQILSILLEIAIAKLIEIEKKINFHKILVAINTKHLKESMQLIQI